MRRLLAVLILAGAARSQTAEGRIAATLGPRWQLLARQFIALAEAMPDAQFNFSPQGKGFAGVRTFGQQVKHVACANVGFFREIAGQEPPAGCETGGPEKAATKAELVRYLRESFRMGDAAIDATTQGNLLAPVNGPYGGPSTRLGIIVLAVWHGADHYGQLVEYARGVGVVPPASQR